LEAPPGFESAGGYSYRHCAGPQITADPAKPIDKRGLRREVDVLLQQAKSITGRKSIGAEAIDPEPRSMRRVTRTSSNSQPFPKS